MASGQTPRDLTNVGGPRASVASGHMLTLPPLTCAAQRADRRRPVLALFLGRPGRGRRGPACASGRPPPLPRAALAVVTETGLGASVTESAG